jgi:hypothetical protein
MNEKVRFCARCRQQIPPERIEALPDTRLCIACSQAVGGEFDILVRQESLGKANSLKKNYGGVEIKKRRRRIEPLDRQS